MVSPFPQKQPLKPFPTHFTPAALPRSPCLAWQLFLHLPPCWHRFRGGNHHHPCRSPSPSVIPTSWNKLAANTKTITLDPWTCYHGTFRVVTLPTQTWVYCFSSNVRSRWMFCDNITDQEGGCSALIELHPLPQVKNAGWQYLLFSNSKLSTWHFHFHSSRSRIAFLQ